MRMILITTVIIHSPQYCGDFLGRREPPPSHRSRATSLGDYLGSGPINLKLMRFKSLLVGGAMWCNSHLQNYESQWKIKHVWNHQAVYFLFISRLPLCSPKVSQMVLVPWLQLFSNHRNGKPTLPPALSSFSSSWQGRSSICSTCQLGPARIPFRMAWRSNSSKPQTGEL